MLVLVLHFCRYQAFPTACFLRVSLIATLDRINKVACIAIFWGEKVVYAKKENGEVIKQKGFVHCIYVNHLFILRTKTISLHESYLTGICSKALLLIFTQKSSSKHYHPGLV